MTDPPDSISTFIKQRRRWINGSNFAQFFVIKNFCQLKETNHSKFSKCWIYVFYIYYTINTGFALLIVGMMYSSFSIMVRDFMKDYDPFEGGQKAPQDYNTVFAKLLQGAYLVLLLWILLISLAADLNYVRCQLNCIVYLYGLIMTMFIVVAYFYFISSLKGISESNENQSQTETDSQETPRQRVSKQVTILLLVAMSLVVFSQLIPLCINCRCNFVKIIVGFISYIFMTPTYVNIFIIYSFCNVHDISWGNRESAGTDSQTDEEKKKTRESIFKTFRLNLLIFWLVINLFGSYTINSFARNQNGGNVILFFSLFLAFTVFFRLMSSIVQRFFECLTNRRHKRRVILKKKEKQDQKKSSQLYKKAVLPAMINTDKKFRNERK